jgi:hypothetical protein
MPFMVQVRRILLQPHPHLNLPLEGGGAYYLQFKGDTSGIPSLSRGGLGWGWGLVRRSVSYLERVTGGLVWI